MADDNLALTFQASDPEVDFESIHDAFMESERGRWFLVEFARRNRHADTALLLAAIGRIESILLAQRAAESVPAPRQDPAVHANPGAIKPDADHESKGAQRGEILRVLAESAARLRDAIKGLRDVSWSMREQGDMRCEVIDRQAVEIAQTAAAFDALRESLGAQQDIRAGFSSATPAAQEPKPPAPVFVLPEPATPIVEPEPAKNFTFAPLFEALPPEHGNIHEQPVAAPLAEMKPEAAADDPFADMLFDADVSPSPTPAESAATADAPIEGPFDSSQAKRLTRLINLFSGAREVAASAPQPEQETPSPSAMATAMPIAETSVERSKAESIVPAAPPEEPKAQGEPADFLLEPWPHASVQPPAEPEAPPAPEPAPMAKAVATAPTVAAASLFPMSRAAPSDPLAPIIALSDEEKIALFS